MPNLLEKVANFATGGLYDGIADGRIGEMGKNLARVSTAGLYDPTASIEGRDNLDAATKARMREEEIVKRARLARVMESLKQIGEDGQPVAMMPMQPMNLQPQQPYVTNPNYRL